MRKERLEKGEEESPCSSLFWGKEEGTFGLGGKDVEWQKKGGRRRESGGRSDKINLTAAAERGRGR